VWKWVRRIALGTLALLVAVVVGIVLYVRTESFRVLVRDQLVTAADGALRGDLRVGAVAGSIWSHITLRDVRLGLAGEDLVVVPEVRLRYALAPLLGGRLEVTGIEVVDPVVRVHQDETGVWDLATALQPTAPSAPPPQQTESSALPIDVSITGIDLGAGRIEFALAGEPERRFVLADVQLEAEADLAGGTTSVTIGNLSTRLTGDAIPPVDLAAGAGLTMTPDRTGIEVRAVDLRMPKSALHLHGTVRDLATLDVDAELALERLAADEMTQLAGGLPGGAVAWPLAVDLAAKLQVSGTRQDLRAELSAQAGDAEIVATASGDLAGDPLRYRADLELRQVEPGILLNRTDVEGVLSGRAQVSGAGTEVASAEADVELQAAGLRVADAKLGDLTTRLRLAGGEASMTGDLVGSGKAHLEGSVSLADEGYQVALDVDELDLGRIGAGRAPRGELNLSARVAGQGFATAAMNAKADVDIRKSRVGEVVVERGKIAARVADARAVIDAFELRAAGSTVTVKGEAGLAGDAPVRLAADVRVPDVAPWLHLVSQPGSGSLSARANVRGKLAALAADAQIEIADLQAAGVRLASASLDADLEGVGGTGQQGRVRAELRELVAGVTARRVGIRVDLAPGDPPHAKIAFEAETEDGPQRLRADVAYGAKLAVLLEELSLVAPTGAWQLDRPAQIVRDEQRLQIAGLRLSSRNGGSLSVEGAIAMTGEKDPGPGLRIRIADLELAPFQVFAGENVDGLRGLVEADIQVRGPLDEIEPTGALRLQDGRAEIVPLGVTLESIALDTRFAADRIEIEGLRAKAGKGSFDLGGEVLLRDRRPDTLDLHLKIENWPAIDTDRYEARVAAAIDASGPLSGPTIGGRVEVLGARLRPPLSLPGSSGPPPRDASIVVIQEQAELEEEGVVTEVAKSTDAFRETAIDVDLVIDRGTWVEKDDTSLELAGEVSVKKDRGDPDVALLGDVRVVRGWIYLYNRRFEPERGVVSFTGGRKIDPQLDVALQSRVGDYLVTTLVEGTASAPKLTFESEPNLEDADILALLMFGRPIHDLGEGEKVALEQQAVGIAANYAAGQLGRALGDALGFRISELDVTKGLVGVGRYITPNTYVSVQQSVTGKASRQVQVEHYLTPAWTLKSQADAEGESGLDVFWRLQY
jgi:autotransporter translocation and assembly factor TamB